MSAGKPAAVPVDDLAALLEACRHRHVLCVGDVMLDRTLACGARRLSQEAPVIVAEERDMLCSPGGAANVAANLRALGLPTTLVAVIGEDEDGAAL